MGSKVKRRELLPLIICAALFFLALEINFLVGEPFTQTEDSALGNSVKITEIMSNNKTYPDQSGKVLDYIEITNLTGGFVDISNYKLSDNQTTIGYTFPQGTVLSPYGSVVCWCQSQGGDTYGAFGISKDGGETIYLYNSSNVIVDQQKVPPMAANQPYLRNEDGSWTVGGLASPGYPNTTEGNAQWLASMGYTTPNVVISEVQASARHTWLDADGTVSDWIELYNQGNKKIVLDGAYLSDDPADPLKWQIPELTLKAGEYVLIRCGGTASSDATFSLASSGGQVILSGIYGNEICVLEYPALERDQTWALDVTGAYAASVLPTPGFENTEAGYDQWLSAIESPQYTVIISEVQTSNCSAVLDSNGQLCDWVELYNPGKQAIVLDGMFLSDDETDPYKWQINDLTLEAGAYAVIPCTGKKGNVGEATFALSKSGCTVILSGPVGNRIAQVECPAMEDDFSWQWVGEGAYIQTTYISPGFENTKDGYYAYRGNQSVMGALAVWEVMASNDRYLIQRDGEYHDWIELKNVSDTVIDLADYAISDSSGDQTWFWLPQKQLAPGELVIIICSGNTELTGNYIHAPFTLNRDTCWVYVTHNQQGLSDYVRVSGVPLMGSAGRVEGENGVFYFATPTPGKENSQGVTEITVDPFVETPDGIYNDVTDVTVVLSGEGQLYYTLDGSEPTMYSTLYTQPLVLTETTVVRVRSYEEGKLPSNVVTASYIINENHTLPVISIAANPSDIFGTYGIYTKYTRDLEIACNLTLYEGDGGFSINCGLEMYGHTGLTMRKKSFKVNFRSLYGESLLSYPVYGEDGPFLYDALCIRAGQDYPQAIFRDELFTSLCRDMTDDVLAQRNKFCILYINGEYFGIYCMKEAFNEMFYAQNRDVRAESVEIVQAPVVYDSEIHAFMRFLRKADMTLTENYEYACTVFDMDSVIDWMIMEGYCANGDVQQNLRYFRSSDDGNRFQMAFYDLDWSFYNKQPFREVLSNERENWQHLMLTQGLMKSPIFRQKFLARLSECMQTTLTNENVLARIEYYYELLAPEVTRERQRWGDTYESWEDDVQILRDYLTERDHLSDIVDRLDRFIDLTQEEIDTYFWRWSK